MAVIRYSLVGKHGHRTPLSYTAYQRLLPPEIMHVDIDDKPDILIFGYAQDFHGWFSEIRSAQKNNPDVKLMVLSEEPLWDTLWSGDYRRRESEKEVNGVTLSYFAINHVNSDVYNYEKIPYFLTTDDRYFARYSFMFKRNASLPQSHFQHIWQKAKIEAAFFAEKRLDEKYSYHHSDTHVRGLCQYRSEMAQTFSTQSKKRTLLTGKGWGAGVVRQKLPDWHLDKLATLDGNCRFISALENTHQPVYITEKIFDAFACQGVPIYLASTANSLRDWLPNNSYINLDGLSVSEAVSHVANFSESSEFLDVYLQAQDKLMNLFKSSKTLERERLRVVDKVCREIQTIASS